MRWDDVAVWLAVARAGSLTGGARTLEVEPSTALRRLDALEASLGQALVERGPRGARLTAAGEALLPLAERLEEDVLALQRAASGHDRRAEGPVRLTLPTDLLGLLAPLLAAFRAECPGVWPDVHAADRSMDLGREADVALRASSRPPDDAVGRRVATIGWAAYRADLTPDDAPWVACGPPLDALPAEAWRTGQPGPVAARANGVEALHHLIALGGLRGTLPRYVGDGDPRLRRIGPTVRSGALWLLVHADLRRSARVRALVDFLTPRLAALAPTLEGAE